MFKSYKTKRDTLIEDVKRKIDFNKDYDNEKKKEMDFIKGKSAEEALKFTLKAVNDDINAYNNDVLNLLRIGLKKSQFSKFKVPKPKYNCKARDLKSISQYDPKSYYYSMDVVLRCTFDNLQYAGGTGAGGELPAFNPEWILTAVNAALGTRAQTDASRTLDGYIQELIITQNIINKARSQLNEVRNKYTRFKKPLPKDEDEKLPELETDREKKGVDIGRSSYSPRKILQKLFLSKKFLEQNPFGLSNYVIKKLSFYTSDVSIKDFPNDNNKIERFINQVLALTVDSDPDYETRLKDYMTAFKEKFKRNPSTLNVTTFMINYIKILLSIELAEVTGENEGEQKWIKDYMKNIVSFRIPKQNYKRVIDLFLLFLLDSFENEDDNMKEEIKIKPPEPVKQDELLKKPDQMTDEQKLEYANMLITDKLKSIGVKNINDEMKEQIINSVINLIIIANKAGVSVTDRFLKALKSYVDKIDLNYITDEPIEESKNQPYEESKPIINYFKSKTFKEDAAKILKAILQGTPGIAKNFIDSVNNILEDLQKERIDIEEEPEPQIPINETLETKQELEYKVDPAGDIVLPPQEGINIDISNVPNNPPLQIEGDEGEEGERFSDIDLEDLDFILNGEEEDFIIYDQDEEVELPQYWRDSLDSNIFNKLKEVDENIEILSIIPASRTKRIENKIRSLLKNLKEEIKKKIPRKKLIRIYSEFLAKYGIPVDIKPVIYGTVDLDRFNNYRFNYNLLM
jgi:hypothetical protein